jgi:hypothetical protein
MADRPNRIRAFTDSLGFEIDRLIKTLPGADPKLLGDPEPMAAPSPATPSSTSSTSSTSSPSRPSRAVAMGGMRTVGAGSSPAATSVVRGFTDRQREQIGAWLRTVAATGLGVAVLYWPYANSCGWLLHTYLGVIAAVLLSGCWASWTAWRARAAAAHVTALIVVFWGIVLAAEQLLPRIGYAAVDAAWKCGA